MKICLRLEASVLIVESTVGGGSGGKFSTLHRRKRKLRRFLRKKKIE
jgi:hypothetical protein